MQIRLDEFDSTYEYARNCLHLLALNGEGRVRSSARNREQPYCAHGSYIACYYKLAQLRNVCATYLGHVCDGYIIRPPIILLLFGRFAKGQYLLLRHGTRLCGLTFYCDRYHLFELYFAIFPPHVLLSILVYSLT